ncbi:MAG TPA: hypothetical protein VGV38_21645, partial [Pyrinomonadaceae bacterium]|nr:hypothetical protein [Pyrinomonadaceae bacterium]
MTRPNFSFRSRASKFLAAAVLLAATCGVLASPLSPLPPGALPFFAPAAPEANTSPASGSR